MKKTFYQLHFGMIIAFITQIMVLVMAVYILINCFSDRVILKNDIMSIVGGVGAIVVVVYSSISIGYNRIICTDDKINITGHRGPKHDRTQFETVILYSEIKGVRMIISNKNSQKETLSEICAAPRLYYEFLMTNGNTKWVFITPFSKKQRKEMLEIINSKTGKNFSYDTLEREDLSIYNIRKSKKSK